MNVGGCRAGAVDGSGPEAVVAHHGGLGGEQTEAFLLHPKHLPLPDEDLIGAAAVHRVLKSWRPAA